MFTVFVSMEGDFPNVGDALIRRMVLDWVRPRRVRAYVGAAPEMWVRQVGLGEEDTVLRHRAGFVRWLVGLATTRQRPALVFEPGELVLARRAFRRQLIWLVAVIVVRLRRGVVLMPPRAVATRTEARASRLTVGVHRLTCRLADLVTWREQWSADLIGSGVVVPDIGFAADVREGRPWSERTTVAVSLRGKRPLPPPAWFEGVRRFAARNDLRLVCFAQVHGDEARATELAEALGADHVPWRGDDLEHEATLRDLYDRARVVVSDRLHVLIVASLSGAVPAELVADPSPKVRTHLERIGLRHVSADAGSMSATDVADFLDRSDRGHDTLVSCVRAAQDELTKVRQDARDLLETPNEA